MCDLPARPSPRVVPSQVVIVSSRRPAIDLDSRREAGKNREDGGVERIRNRNDAGIIVVRRIGNALCTRVLCESVVVQYHITVKKFGMSRWAEAGGSPGLVPKGFDVDRLLALSLCLALGVAPRGGAAHLGGATWRNPPTLQNWSKALD